MVKALLFLHGWASSPDIWQKQREYFKDYNILMPELHSDNLRDLTKKIYLLCHRIDNLVIIGWSMGWLVALKLLEYAELKIKALVSIGGMPKFVSDDYVNGGIRYLQIRALRFALKKDFVSTLNNFYRQHGIPQSAEKFIKNKNLYIKQLQILEKEDLRNNLSLIKCPTLFIAGRNDSLCPVSIQEYMSSRVKGSVVKIVEDSSHAPFLDKDKEVNALINEFIISIP